MTLPAYFFPKHTSILLHSTVKAIAVHRTWPNLPCLMLTLAEGNVFMNHTAWCTSTAVSSQYVLHHLQNRHQQQARYFLEAAFAHPTMDSSCHLVEDLAILNSVLTQSLSQLLNSEYALSGVQNLAVTCC